MVRFVPPGRDCVYCRALRRIGLIGCYRHWRTR